MKAPRGWVRVCKTLGFPRGSALGKTSYKSFVSERSCRVKRKLSVLTHHNFNYFAYAFVHHPMEGNSTLGKLAMARRDSLQDFETTPRPLLFAPPLHLPPKDHNINPALYGIQRG